MHFSKVHDLTFSFKLVFKKTEFEKVIFARKRRTPRIKCLLNDMPFKSASCPCAHLGWLEVPLLDGVVWWCFDLKLYIITYAQHMLIPNERDFTQFLHKIQDFTIWFAYSLIILFLSNMTTGQLNKICNVVLKLILWRLDCIRVSSNHQSYVFDNNGCSM